MKKLIDDIAMENHIWSREVSIRGFYEKKGEKLVMIPGSDRWCPKCGLASHGVNLRIVVCPECGHIPELRDLEFYKNEDVY